MYFKMDVEYDSDLSNTEEIDDSGTMRLYEYEPIRREREENSEDEDVENSLSFDGHEFHIVQIRMLLNSGVFLCTLGP